MLFANTNKIKEYAEFTEVNYASVKLTIRQVEEAQLIPILGMELYTSINTAFNADTTEAALTEKQKNLLDMCRMVIGPYLVYNYAPKSEVQLSDSGLRRAETATLKTAYNYQGLNFREQKLREGELAAEALLRFLELNKTDYPEWLSSTAFAAYRSLFIKTAEEFDTLFTTASPYRNYWAWRYKMYDVEEDIIRDALGSALFDHLKEINAAADGVFTEAEQIMLTKLKRAIAYYTVAAAIPYHNVRIDDKGLTIVSDNATVASKDMQARNPATAASISQLQRNAESSGKVWLQKAIDYITQYPEDFPDYTIALPCQDNVNDCLNGSFGLL